MFDVLDCIAEEAGYDFTQEDAYAVRASLVETNVNDGRYMEIAFHGSAAQVDLQLAIDYDGSDVLYIRWKASDERTNVVVETVIRFACNLRDGRSQTWPRWR